jgi:hypothetical protein
LIPEGEFLEMQKNEISVNRLLLELERQEIDRQFEVMAMDTEYQAMNRQLSEDFAESDWEALADTDV